MNHTESNPYKNIKHTELYADLSMMNISDMTLWNNGQISVEPEAWLIECTTKDDEYVTEYRYDLESEFDNDCKILGI